MQLVTEKLAIHHLLFEVDRPAADNEGAVLIVMDRVAFLALD